MFFHNPNRLKKVPQGDFIFESFNIGFNLEYRQSPGYE